MPGIGTVADLHSLSEIIISLPSSAGDMPCTYRSFLR